MANFDGGCRNINLIKIIILKLLLNSEFKLRFSIKCQDSVSQNYFKNLVISIIRLFSFKKKSFLVIFQISKLATWVGVIILVNKTKLEFLNFLLRFSSHFRCEAWENQTFPVFIFLTWIKLVFIVRMILVKWGKYVYP